MKADDRRVSYAQNREDIILDAYFPDVKNGFYVDVGASHPVVSSVTKLFYEKGWSGVNIEPSPKYYRLLVEDRPRDKNVNTGIGLSEEVLKFREYKGYGLSTFSTDMQQAYEKDDELLTSSYKDYDVPVRPLRDVLKDLNVHHINFMKVDVEGFEYEVLAGNDWKKYRPEVLCVESNHIIKDWRPLLKKEGYTKHFFDGLNDYYVANESLERAKNFSYADSILLGKPVIPLQWHQEIGRLQKNAHLEAQTLKSKQKELERTIELLQARIVSASRIRSQAKSLARNLDDALAIQIRRLDKPRRRQASVPVPLAKDPGVDRQRILNAIRINDFESFYSVHTSGTYRHSAQYKLANALHHSARAGARQLKKVVVKSGVLRKVTKS